MKNSVHRKRNSCSTLTKANIPAHATQINTRPVCSSQMSSVFTSVPPLFGTAQAFLLRLAQLEAQLVLNLIGNVAAGNNSGYGNPFNPLLQPVGIQRSSFLSMYQPPGVFTLSHLVHRKNMDSIPRMVSPLSSSLTEINSVIAHKESSDLLAKEVIQEKTQGLLTSEEPFVRSSRKHLSKQFTFKPDVDCSQYHSMTAKVMPPERPQIEDVDPKKPAMLHFPTENLIKALASLGLSLEDLEFLSHCPDNQLTPEKLPLIIQDIQKRKGTRDTEYAGRNASDQVESSRKSSYAPGKHHDQRRIRCSEWEESAIPSPCGQSCGSYFHRSINPESYSPSELIHHNFSTHSRGLKRIRVPSGRGSNAFIKRLHHGAAEVSFPSRSKRKIRGSFVSPDCNKTKYYTAKRPLSPSHRSTESMNIQMSVTAAKTSTQTKGVIRVSGIHFDYSESDLIKMASPFGHPADVLMATEVDRVTGLERKKALLVLPDALSAQEMVKVYSAIPVHMRQQCLELVSQTVDFSSPVSVFHAFVGPSMSNGLLTPLDHLLVVCNVPNQACAATGLLRLLKPFGQVLQTLVFNANKVDIGQCLWEKSSIQMVLEMESASVASSVYEWSHKIPCLYHNHHLSFFRGCDVQKN